MICGLQYSASDEAYDERSLMLFVMFNYVIFIDAVLLLCSVSVTVTGRFGRECLCRCGQWLNCVVSKLSMLTLMSVSLCLGLNTASDNDLYRCCEHSVIHHRLFTLHCVKLADCTGISE